MIGTNDMRKSGKSVQAVRHDDDDEEEEEEEEKED